MSGCRHLVFILGDQLSEGLSSLEGFDRARDRVLMVEVMEEATYVRHHPKKIAFIFSAMRHFAEGLRERDLWSIMWRSTIAATADRLPASWSGRSSG